MQTISFENSPALSTEHLHFFLLFFFFFFLMKTLFVNVSAIIQNYIYIVYFSIYDNIYITNSNEGNEVILTLLK